MVYRNKTYVAFDGDKDINYYRTMQMWRKSDNNKFNFYDSHDLNNALDTSSEETIKQRLRERLANSKSFILLVGEGTRYLYKFVRWEIEQAINLDLPVIIVNLPKTVGSEGKRSIDYERCPKIAKNTLAVHVSFRAKILQYALENWPNSYEKHSQRDESGPYYYKDRVYQKLNL